MNVRAVRAIWLKRCKRGPMDPQETATLRAAGVRLEGTRGRTLRIGPCRLRIFSECRSAAHITGPGPVM